MFLDYAALVILILGLLMVFYTFIYIHDIPYQIAKQRNHPQQEAIHVACWLSLFTLEALWPLVFMWAVSKPKTPEMLPAGAGTPEADPMRERLAALEERLRRLEAAQPVEVST